MNVLPQLFLLCIGLTVTALAQPTITLAPATEVRYTTTLGNTYTIEQFDPSTEIWTVIGGPFPGDGSEQVFYFPLYTNDPAIIRVVEMAISGGFAPDMLDTGLLVTIDEDDSALNYFYTSEDSGIRFTENGARNFTYTFQKTGTNSAIVMHSIEFEGDESIELTFLDADTGFYSNNGSAGVFSTSDDAVDQMTAPDTLPVGAFFVTEFETTFITETDAFLTLTESSGIESGTFAYSKLNSYEASIIFDDENDPGVPPADAYYFLDDDDGFSLGGGGITVFFDYDTSNVGVQRAPTETKAGERLIIWPGNSGGGSSGYTEQYQTSSTSSFRFSSDSGATFQPFCIDHLFTADNGFIASFDQDYPDSQTESFDLELLYQGEGFGALLVEDDFDNVTVNYFEYDTRESAADFAPTALTVGNRIAIVEDFDAVSVVIVSATEARALPVIDGTGSGLMDTGGTGTFTYTKESPTTATFAITYDDDGVLVTETYKLVFLDEAGGTYVREGAGTSNVFLFDDFPVGLDTSLAAGDIINFEGNDSTIYILSANSSGYRETDFNLLEMDWSQASIDPITRQFTAELSDNGFTETIVNELVFFGPDHGIALLPDDMGFEFRVDRTRRGLTTRPDGFVAGDEIILVGGAGNEVQVTFNSPTSATVDEGQGSPYTATIGWEVIDNFFGEITLTRPGFGSEVFAFGFGGDGTGISGEVGEDDTNDIGFFPNTPPVFTKTTPTPGIQLSFGDDNNNEVEFVFNSATTGFVETGGISDLVTYSFQSTGTNTATIDVTDPSDTITYTLEYTSANSGLIREEGGSPTLPISIFRFDSIEGTFAPTALTQGDTFAFDSLGASGDGLLQILLNGSAYYDGGFSVAIADITFAELGNNLIRLVVTYEDSMGFNQTETFDLIFASETQGFVWVVDGMGFVSASEFTFTAGSAPGQTAPASLGEGDFIRAESEGMSMDSVFSLRFTGEDSGMLLGSVNQRNSGEPFSHTYTRAGDDSATLLIEFADDNATPGTETLDAQLYFTGDGNGYIVYDDAIGPDTRIQSFSTNIHN